MNPTPRFILALARSAGAGEFRPEDDQAVARPATPTRYETEADAIVAGTGFLNTPQPIYNAFQIWTVGDTYRTQSVVAKVTSDPT